ncbi:hypothetical protein [Lacinutrix sp. MedPE-SW]|uniref:hypothetical protein n=1 Tax=Lacinutrix sp. MedPE-SW TaxID=1860087 RepID=UPI000922864A|nr:hypothetical protein [Lacinutrix sp. MedPE-SW]OIQ24106.1 MAG: hypothetical protein BM549_02020 [Lacinutrix sp. MedPE-SW]
MTSKELQDLHSRLVIKLWNNFFFFIPIEIFDLELLEETPFKDYKEILFNKLSVIDFEYGAFYYDPEIDNIRYVKKTKELNELTFELIEEKNKLKDYEFSFLIDKYFEQTECVLHISNWLNNNINCIQEITPSITGLFKIQLFLYKKHLNEIIKQFYPDRKKIAFNNHHTLRIIESNFETFQKPLNLSPLPKLNRNLKDNNKKEPTEIKAEQSPVEKTNKQKKVKKKPLVTEEEARKMILKSIFNIDE